MERPSTSKSRGICRYYNTRQGCFAGDSCKFLHGADERYTPYDKAKVCRYYVKGHCTRGDSCWFRHEHPKLPPGDERVQYHGETCAICMEKPITYGLLTDCSHVFCLQCIRQWRDKDGKSSDMVSTGSIKCCPLCRGPSRFITPSTHFFPSGHPQKDEIIETYKASMARVSCKYFEETSRNGKPCCPFGSDCFYKHTNPDGTPHVFRHGAQQAMNHYRRYLRNRGNGSRRTRSAMEDTPVQLLQRLFEGQVSLEVLRASIPALIGRATANNPESPSPTLQSLLYPDSDEDPDESDMENVFEALLDDIVMRWTLAQENEAPQVPDNDDPSDPPAPLPSVVMPDTNVSTPANAEASDESVDTSGSAPLPVSEPTPTPAGNTPPTRFSATVNINDRETLIIDVSEEDNSEAVSPSDSYEDNTADSRKTQDSAPPPPSSPAPGLDRCHAADSDVHDTPMAGTGAGETRGDRADSEHPAEPPFVTDGRGRVVWSSPHNGRGVPVEGGREAQWVRAGSTKSTNAAGRT